MFLETPNSPQTALHSVSLGWTPVAPLSEEESSALPGWSPPPALFLLHPNPQCEETPSLPQPFSGEAGWCQRSALCILAPLPTPEVTIPEQKLSKGKGAKTGSKEKRSILMESEVGWEKWGGEHVPGVQAPSPSWDGVSSPVLWQQPLHLACALGPACFPSQPGLAGVTELSAPRLLLGAPFLILASTQSAPQMPSVSLQHTHSCSHSCRGDRALWPCQQLSGGQGVFLIVALPSRCAQQL